MNIPKLLIIEDDEEINNLICETLKKENYNIIQSFDGENGLSKYDNTFHLVILDLMLPYYAGLLMKYYMEI